MGTLIDSSVLIAAERGQLDLDAVLGERKDEQLRLAAITVGESRHTCAGQQAPIAGLRVTS